MKDETLAADAAYYIGKIIYARCVDGTIRALRVTGLRAESTGRWITGTDMIEGTEHGLYVSPTMHQITLITEDYWQERQARDAA